MVSPGQVNVLDQENNMAAWPILGVQYYALTNVIMDPVEFPQLKQAACLLGNMGNTSAGANAHCMVQCCCLTIIHHGHIPIPFCWHPTLITII